MNLQEAYRKLGYKDLWPNPRQPDWSAEKPDGVCISLWLNELKNRPRLNTKEDCGDISIWGNTAKNRKRIVHMKIAQDKFDGLVDVVFLEGDVGSVESARISPDKRKWKIIELDCENGHFSVEMLSKEAANA